MKKVLVIVLLLMLLSLTGIEGCTPNIPSFSKGNSEVIRLRGLSIEFEKERPHLGSKEGERLPVVRAGDEFDIGLRVKNYLLKPISGTITISDLGSYSTLEGKESQGFGVESAVLQDDVIYPGEELIDFGPYIYDNEKIGNGVDMNLITEVDLQYNAAINLDLCFRKGEAIQGVFCNNEETLLESSFKGDAGGLPVSIDRIEKEVSVRESEAQFYLTLKLKNFGDGIIKDNKINGLSANLIGGSINCDNEAIFRDGKAEIECRGSVSFGEESFTKLPIEFIFNYPYKVVRTINYRVVPGQNI